jgi:hypothetical protein
MGPSDWLTAFATVSLASAAIGEILEYVCHTMRHGKKDSK